MKKIYLLIAISFAFSSCEKDDVCDANTPTTPRLIIEFYDSVNNSDLKNLTNLKVIAEGMDEGIIFNESGTEITKYLTSQNKISLPLRITENVTKYRLILNSNVPSTINEDIIELSYDKEEVFVSRACGYKTIFGLTNTNLNIVAVDSNNWIDDIDIIEPNITSENDVHIKIYF